MFSWFVQQQRVTFSKCTCAKTTNQLVTAIAASFKNHLKANKSGVCGLSYDFFIHGSNDQMLIHEFASEQSIRQYSKVLQIPICRGINKNLTSSENYRAIFSIGGNCINNVDKWTHLGHILRSDVKDK